MKRRLILHAGMPKCGSTGLQLALASNRAALAAAGIVYPRVEDALEGGLQHMALVNALVAASRGGVASLCPMLQDMLAAFDRSGARTLVLSSESFAVRAAKLAPAAFGTLLRDLDTTLLLFVRRRDRWLLSFYKQCVRAAPRLYLGSFETFLAEPPTYARNLDGPMVARAARTLKGLTRARETRIVDLDRAGDSRVAMGELLDQPLAAMPGDARLLPPYYAALAAHGLAANASLSDLATAFLAALDRRAFTPAMLVDLDVALAITPLDDIAPRFALMGEALSARLIADGRDDRRRLHHRHGVPSPPPPPPPRRAAARRDPCPRRHPRGARRGRVAGDRGATAPAPRPRHPRRAGRWMRDVTRPRGSRRP